MSKKGTFELGQTVVGMYNGKEYAGIIEDHAGDEYSVRTTIWRTKKWWKASELVATKLTEKKEDTMAVKDDVTGYRKSIKKVSKVVDNTLVKQEKVTLVPVNMASKVEEPTVVAVSTQEESKEKKFRDEHFSPDFLLLPATDVTEDGTIKVALSQLINLDATPIKNARYAMREINQQHKEMLKIGYIRGDDMPAITVVPSTMGYIVVDGNHRWSAMESIVENSLDIFKKEDLTPEKSAALKDRREKSVLFVTPLNGMTERATIQFAFEANLRNGLPSSENSRSRYAIWLLEDAKENGDKLSLRQAAMIAGVSHVAVIKMRRREADRQGKMVDTWGDSEHDTEEVLIEEKGKKQVDTLQVNTKKLFAAIKAICKEVDEPEKLAIYFREFVTDTNMAQDSGIISQALEQFIYTEEEHEEENDQEDGNGNPGY